MPTLCIPTGQQARRKRLRTLAPRLRQNMLHTIQAHTYNGRRRPHHELASACAFRKRHIFAKAPRAWWYTICALKRAEHTIGRRQPAYDDSMQDAGVRTSISEITTNIRRDTQFSHCAQRNNAVSTVHYMFLAQSQPSERSLRSIAQ